MFKAKYLFESPNPFIKEGNSRLLSAFFSKKRYDRDILKK